MPVYWSLCIYSCQLFALLSSVSDLPTQSFDHLIGNKHIGLHLSKHIYADDNSDYDYVLVYCLPYVVSLRTDHSLPFPQHLKQCLLGKSRCSVIFFFYCMNNEITLRVLLDYGLMLSASFQQEDANKLPLLSS